MAFFVLTVIFAIVTAIGIVYGRAHSAEGREVGDQSKARRGRFIALAFWVGGAVALIGTVLGFSIHRVDNGHVGLVKQFGALHGTKEAGAAFIAPWQEIASVDIRTQSQTFVMDDQKQAGTGSAVSVDNQQVFATVTLNYAVDPTRVVSLYRSTGGHYREVLINPRVPQTFKAVTAKYRAVNIAANREAIRRETQKRLDGQLDRDGIHVTDFLIENVHFTPEFQKALEDTQVAKQRAKQEEARIAIETAKALQREARARGIANANVIEATGQAKANRLLGQSLSADVIHFKAVEKLASGVRTILLPSNSGLILPPELTTGTTGSK